MTKGSLGVDWYLPGKNRRFATTTVASNNVIRVVAECGHTCGSAVEAIIYDPEAKAVMQYFVDHGYGDTYLAELIDMS